MLTAYDIAIIPPQNIIDLCININNSIQNTKNIDFITFPQIPHITLLMGGVEEENISIIENELKVIAENIEPIEIVLESLYVGKLSSEIKIRKTNEILNLRNLIISKFGNFFNNQVSTSNIIGFPNLSEGTANIINYFIKLSAHENFDPHITIGDGEPNFDISNTFPISFLANNIQLGKMGNYCTSIK